MIRRSPLPLPALIGVAAAVGVLLTATLFIFGGSVRAVLAVPLVLILPGYALTMAALPNLTLGFVERLIFTLGLSLAIAVVGGVVLNLTPWGLQEGTWAAWLGTVTVVAGVIAILRRRMQADTKSSPVIVGLSMRQTLVFGLAICITLGAIGLARYGATQQQSASFTQLWIQPVNQGGMRSVHLGVESMERQPTQYRLELKSDGSVVREWPSIDLAPGKTWETTATLATGTGSVEAILYRAEAPETVYRFVILRNSGQP